MLYVLLCFLKGSGMGGRSRSQQKSRDDRDRDRGKNEPRKIINISIGQDVKLHQTENAWKPQPLNKETAAIAKEKPTEDDTEVNMAGFDDQINIDISCHCFEVSMW